jgi:hypothetical protein
MPAVRPTSALDLLPELLHRFLDVLLFAVFVRLHQMHHLAHEHSLGKFFLRLLDRLHGFVAAVEQADELHRFAKCDETLSHRIGEAWASCSGATAPRPR